MSSSRTRTLENLLEAVPDALVGMDQEGVIRFVNRQTEALFGYDREELVGIPVDTLIPETLRRIYSEHRDTYSADPESRASGLEVDLMGRKRDGSDFPARIHLSDIDTGDVLLLIGELSLAHDETQAKEAFDAARAMIESSLDALVAISPDGLITDLNQATVKATGLSREELIGTALADCFTETEKAHETHLRAIEEGTAAYYPLTIRHRDGTSTEVLYNASVYRSPEGEILGVFAAARDVSEVTRAFEASRSMIESSLDALVAISPEGLITDLNEATIKLTGIPRQELIGTAFSDCFTEPEKADVIYQKVFADGMAVDYPLCMRNRNGTLTEVMYNASVYRNPEGEVLGVFAAARDVTPQKKAEAETAVQRGREQERLYELEKFRELTVHRELKMIDLKKEIESLRSHLPGDTDDVGGLDDLGDRGSG